MLPTERDSFYAPKTPLQAAVATMTTGQDTYYASDCCFASPNSRTAKHSITVTRLSDGAVAPACNSLLVKAGGYSSVTGMGNWPTFHEAAQALLERGVQWFEGVDAGLDHEAVSKLGTSKLIREAILAHADELFERGYVPAIARFPEPLPPLPAAEAAQPSASDDDDESDEDLDEEGSEDDTETED